MASYALTLLSGNIDSRSKSDRQLHFLTDALLLPLITLGIWGLLVLYWLISRRDEHFRREHALNRDLVQTLKERIQASGIDPYALPEMSSLEAALRQKEQQEQPKGAGLWLILNIVTLGLTWFYVGFFLTVDYFRHEQRQLEFIQKLNALLARAGIAAATRYEATLPERHYWLNLLGVVLTLGLWGIIWQYRLLSDPNRHFERQWTWEDNLVPFVSTAVQQLQPPVPARQTTSPI